MGQDQPRARKPGRHRLSERERPHRGPRTRSASTSSATAARPASAIRGPLAGTDLKAINDNDLVAVSVLSGNRNFEGRVSPDCRANYLASPPLVVAFALKGTVRSDMVNEPIGHGGNGEPVFLKDIWPTQRGNPRADRPARPFGHVPQALCRRLSRRRSLARDRGHGRRDLQLAAGSTYIQNPPYFDRHDDDADAARPTSSRRGALAVFGDSITTDHISPAGAIKPDSPAGRYLLEQRGRPRRVQQLRRAPRQP